MSVDETFDSSKPFVSQVGLEYVRGCEVEGMLDDAGKVGVWVCKMGGACGEKE